MGRGLSILAPRRLRWRLVLGFAATVALLLAALTAAERILVEQSLMHTVEQSLETAVRLGVADVMATRKDTGAKTSSSATSFWAIAPNTSVTASHPTPDSPQERLAVVIQAIMATNRLTTLAQALALPNQPVAMLDARGDVIATSAAAPPQERWPTRFQPAAVLSSLLHTASQHIRNLPPEGWSGRVATPDGAYLLVLTPMPVQIINPAEASGVSDSAAQQVLLKKLYASLAAQAGGQKRDSVIVLDKGKLGVTETPATSQIDFLRKVRPSSLVVLIARSLAETSQTVDAVTTISLGGALVVIMLATVLALLVVGAALRPLAAITAGAERLAEGDYGHRLVLHNGTDEVGRLAATFDRMATAISTAFAAQRRFVADASHELRTPLTALRGYTDVLLMGVGAEDRATVNRILVAMQDDLGRMSRLVDDLLTLARLDGGVSPRLRSLSLTGMLTATAQEGAMMGGGTQEILLDPGPGNLMVWGDRDRLLQVFANIVGNACAYSPPGSHIHLRASQHGHWALVTVQDDGPGIPPDELARLGERFFRGDSARSRRTGGTGLGLAIARGILATHGGSLAIESAPGRGTAVTISLPVVVAPELDGPPT